jgi:predicted DNA-binding transcriptional regulator AlpA
MNNQARIILREVHLIVFKEMERLNLRIVELENQNRQQVEKPILITPASHPTPVSPSLPPKPAEMLNEKQVANYLSISVATVRRWRLFRSGPKYLKIGSAVRYKREDLETWIDSCSALC